MPWTGRSFMIDIKPQSQYANLFVECPENDDRDLIRILKNGVELCASPETNEAVDAEKLEGQINAMKLDDGSATADAATPANFHHNHSLRACIKGFCLHPESVTNYAWTEDQHTFSCKLKVDIGDDDSDRKTWFECVKLLKKGPVTVEQYCSPSNKNLVLECNKCGQVLQRNHAQLFKCFPLPSTDINEIMDDVFCHMHDHGHDAINGHVTNSTPKGDQCFVGATYLLLNSNSIDPACLVTEADVLVCKQCHQQLGCLHCSGYGVDKKDAYRFYHIATNFRAKKEGITEIEKNFFELRYETKERYFAWLLLSECESQSSLKFVIKSLDSHPKLLVWLLDSYSVIVSGKLDEEDKTNDNQELVPLCKSFPALKLLFKVLNDSSLSDPRVSGQDASVVSLTLPMEACEILNSYLEANSECFPPACRLVGQFSVGFLHITPEI